MRIRVTVAAVSGALALSAFAVPAAQAGPQGDGGLSRPTAAERFGVPSAGSGLRATAAAGELPKVSKVTVNSGKDIVVGTTGAKKFTVSVTASHSTGIADAFISLWHGTNTESGLNGLLLPSEDAAACTAASATTSTCKLTISATPGRDLPASLLAGTWHVSVGVLARDDVNMYWNDYQTTHRVQRASTLTANAAPEPVKKGKTITVTGKLARANWDTLKYGGYSTQPVKLQFRKKGSTVYTTVKTIKTSTTGTLKTTVKASVDGYYRYVFAGSTTTPAVNAMGDFIDVK
ncbi:DUF5707 domain-containing protein [Streptomyces sp. NPDC002306]